MILTYYGNRAYLLGWTICMSILASTRWSDEMSTVSDIPCASPQAIEQRFVERLSFETDCWDVHEAMRTNKMDFVLLDVRGPKLYAASHIPGAINLPHGKMIASKMQAWPEDTLFVVYCAGPHCNGTDRAALRLGRLGRKVKVMIGGMTGWADEGFSFAAGVPPRQIAEAAE
jgi:rhodanese-related sulfurtransferase